MISYKNTKQYKMKLSEFPESLYDLQDFIDTNE